MRNALAYRGVIKKFYNIEVIEKSLETDMKGFGYSRDKS